MRYLLIAVLCIASALVGRLVLTREEAWRTIKVRVPAVGLLVLATVVLTAASLIFAAGCFVCGSFYGLHEWWLPKLGSTFEGLQDIVNTIITGRWE